VNISSATFISSAPDLDSCPDESLPEFAFIGRSNVGKSSLLNLLTGKRDLAKVSPTPGSTRLINFFLINRRWRLVDLPGYGFAHVARRDMSKFNAAVGDYLQNRPNLCCVFALIDSGIPPQKMDLEFVEWLATNSVPFVLVFTKTDTGTPKSVERNIAAFTAAISDWCPKPPEIYTCSSKSMQGRGALLTVVDEAMSIDQSGDGDAPLKPVTPSDGTSASSGKTGSKPPPGRRPDRDAARPW
jgi:GTP-binding protein